MNPNLVKKNLANIHALFHQEPLTDLKMYRAVLDEINYKISKGPLKDLVTVCGITQTDYGIYMVSRRVIRKNRQMSFRTKNKLKNYQDYFNKLIYYCYFGRMTLGEYIKVKQVNLIDV